MKLTKKSYNRRIYVFGIMVFLSIALISTGFATWVMSKNATENPEGSINVGTITDGAIKFDEVSFENGIDEFKFEPAKGDVEGDIKWDASVADPVYENLSVTLIGTISPASYFNDLTIQLTELPEGVIKAAEYGYLELPECYGSAKEVSVEKGTETVTFSYTIEFKWGSKFGGENPSIYLDERVVTDDSGEPVLDDQGKTTPYYNYEEKKDILVDFRRMIYQLPESYSDEDVMKYTTDSTNELKYKVTLTASANV